MLNQSLMSFSGSLVFQSPYAKPLHSTILVNQQKKKKKEFANLCELHKQNTIWA
jgi:hypothetical protein